MLRALTEVVPVGQSLLHLGLLIRSQAKNIAARDLGTLGVGKAADAGGAVVNAQKLVVQGTLVTAQDSDALMQGRC